MHEIEIPFPLPPPKKRNLKTNQNILASGGKTVSVVVCPKGMLTVSVVVVCPKGMLTVSVVVVCPKGMLTVSVVVAYPKGRFTGSALYKLFDTYFTFRAV